MKILMSMTSAERGLKQLISAMGIMGFGVDKKTSRGVLITFKSTPIKFEFEWIQSVGAWVLIPINYAKKITNPKKIFSNGSAPQYVYEMDLDLINSLYEIAQARKKKLENESKAAQFKSELLVTYIKGSITGKGISIIGGRFDEVTVVRRSKRNLFSFRYLIKSKEKFNDTDMDDLIIEVTMGNLLPQIKKTTLGKVISEWEDGTLLTIANTITDLEDSHQINLNENKKNESLETQKIKTKFTELRNELINKFSESIKKAMGND